MPLTNQQRNRYFRDTRLEEYLRLINFYVDHLATADRPVMEIWTREEYNSSTVIEGWTILEALKIAAVRASDETSGWRTSRPIKAYVFCE